MRGLGVFVICLVFAIGCWRQAGPGGGTSAALPTGPAIDFDERSIDDYKDNPVRADEKYKGKLVRIADKVAGIKQVDGKPAATFFRYYGVQTDGEPQVLCVFDDPKDVATLNQYFPAELEGVVVGRVNDGINRGPGRNFLIRVEHCRLKKP